MSKSKLTVLTGDIVRSSRLGAGELDGLMDALRAAADTAAGWDSSGGDAKFTRFRGDGWQCLAASPALALRTMLFLRASVRVLGRNFDTRISVGVETGGAPGPGDLSDASGPAFEASGRGLDTMAGAARWRLMADDAAAETGVLFSLCDEISRRWTPAQARVFRLQLPPEPMSQAAIAGELGVRQQTVASHLTNGGEWALSEALAAVEGGLEP